MKLFKESTLLLIDDEDNVRASLEAILSLDGYAIIHAKNGNEGLQCLNEFSPDVILLDIMMPDMDGIEVCRQIRSNPQWNHTPIIIITALDTKQDLYQSLEAGADDFLPKPVDSLELRARVKSLLRIKHQYDELEEFIRFRDDLENMLIHDIRSPLMIIMSACENLLHADLNEMEKRWAEKIQIQANRLNNQMNDMLLLAKMEENHLALSLQPTDVASLLEEIRQNHAPIAAARHLQLEIAIPEEPTVIEVDQSLFARVLDNLVSNAIKYTHPHTSVSIYTLKYHEEGVPWVKICVADEGPGIPEEYREKIFNKYEIINLKKNRGVTQIGLGLAFCKLVVDAHQGRINVCNNEPQGSIFSVSMRLL